VDATARLAAAVPVHVRDVCARLAEAGFQAVTVGGAVRDVLLGREPGDWDVATSARPDDVLKLFRRTIPTGLQHGTVTIVTGKGADTHVEVTTYRGEGAYTDARRPDSVVFGVPLQQDLLRRDLTVNAIAYDVAGSAIFDPFEGVNDLERRVLRAVGDPVARFTEDGLRVMRVARFASQLGFELDPATEAAIEPALASLSKVSRERVCDELRKLLAGNEPRRGLEIAARTGILAAIFGAKPLDLVTPERVEPGLRLAAFVAPMQDRRLVVETLKALKFSNAEAELAGALASGLHAVELAQNPTELRRALAAIGRPFANELAKLDLRAASVIADPLVPKELAINGNDLLQAGCSGGKALGDLLDKLLAKVHEDPSHNTRDQLLALAKELA
jgi:tRNA nucleotidyltransferase (CCA-adding enzyme)